MAIVGEPYNIEAQNSWFIPEYVVRLYYKANTCANNLALSLIVFCPLLHCRHSCQFTFS